MRAPAACSSTLRRCFLLLEPGGVVALPRDAVAAVELENPAGDVVEEVAVVGHGDDRARILLEEMLEPAHRLGVEVVGRFVEQQHVGLRQQQPAQRDAAPLAARDLRDVGVPRRQAQRVGGHLELVVEVVAVGRLDDRLELRLLGGDLVEVGVRLGVGRIDGLELRERVRDVGDRHLDVAAHVLGRIELGLLREEADLDAGLRSRLALEILVHAGHDPQQRGLARAVETEHADLGAGEEAERDVAQDHALRRHDLADAVHGVDVLGHGLGLRCRGGKGPRLCVLRAAPRHAAAPVAPSSRPGRARRTPAAVCTRSDALCAAPPPGR